MANFPINIIYYDEPDYPPLLKQLKKPPRVLYYRGNLSNINAEALDSEKKSLINIAFVGSRKITFYGKQAVEFLISGLSKLPVCIVSGLAYGIDAYSHEIAIKSGLKTLAVLGSGIDDASIYPRINKLLAHKILNAGGAIISEYKPGTAAADWHFPERNLIIAGLCKGVVIIEAAEKSGALITAKHALDENRDVFAVPGSIFQDSSKGANNLIKGLRAKAISSSFDIINEYLELKRLALATQSEDQLPESESLSPIQKQIFSAISAQGSNIEEILEKTKLPVQEINSNLILLEIQNKIKALGNNFYARNLSPSIRKT
jgi:DNA processing protein